MHLEQMQMEIEIFHQAQALHHQMHGTNATTVHALGAWRHLIVDVTGFKHRSRLILPVLWLQTSLDSLFAVAQDFGVASIHSKWPLLVVAFFAETHFSQCLEPFRAFFPIP